MSRATMKTSITSLEQASSPDSHAAYNLSNQALKITVPKTPSEILMALCTDS